MNSKKITSYLLYALGEILLVVIGIMIAVSLNNWNDARKAQQSERKLLTELQSALKADLADIEFNIGWHNSARTSCELLLKVMEEKPPYHDSLGYLFGSMGRFSQFLPDMGTYESIKSAGIGLISNDSLRIKISRYYENEIKFAVGNEAINRSLLPQTLQFLQSLFYIKELVVYSEPRDYKALLENDDFKSYLYSTMSFRIAEEQMFRETGESCKELINLIDKELTTTY